MVSYFTIDGTGETTNFQKEISSMMHGFGDNPNPNAATVVLVENIVLQQLRLILQEALQLSVARGGKAITNYEIIFQMRYNLIKLKRLHDYQNKISNIEKRTQLSPTETMITGVMSEDDKDPLLKKKRKHIDIIKELDETDEISLIKFDAIDYLRKIRAAKITESMPFEKYEAYHKARCTSFKSTGYGIGKGFVKLEMWINPTKELKITQSALEVLCFLAYETVAEIVDGVFLIRQDAKKKHGDPFSKFEGGYFCNPSSISNAVYSKSGYEGVPAITVAEVREVLRRYFSTKTGMNGLFYRNMNLDLPPRYIAF